jgi:hypothetical protein
MLVANDKWSVFLIKYKYGVFIHVSKDEFLWLHLQLHLRLQCTPIVLFTHGSLRMWHVTSLGFIETLY